METQQTLLTESNIQGVIPANSLLEHKRHQPLRVCLLGATGSIGKQTIDVIRQNPQKVELVGLACGHNAQKLVELTQEFPSVTHIVLADVSQKNNPLFLDVPKSCNIAFGDQALLDMIEACNCDCVVNALVGFAGMRASEITLKAGLELALANKESLVIAGDLLMPLVQPHKLLPVDSEHSAIFQCFLGQDARHISQIWLTASGGPFFGKTRDDLKNVTAKQALAHPNWSMGAKVTIDSSTLMNKGLEAMEAHHLFAVDYSQIHIVIQRQSAIHSMVEYSDGSVIAHIGAADMRVPIEFALSYPERWGAPAKPLDFAALKSIDFANPDMDTFGCIRLALHAGTEGGILPCVLNAADEIAVQAFLEDRIGYLDIERVVETTLSQFTPLKVESFDQLTDVDTRARALAREASGK
ncbi:MAG: 1-deoxy-D-xylulose-5-phosphate reductoisomerase [Coriobacteriales bacterium]|nr:1-deoxy-D-xylulose-5-phosphate reductoisomerase [Coriobacteriales bacterium]